MFGGETCVPLGDDNSNSQEVASETLWKGSLGLGLGICTLNIPGTGTYYLYHGQKLMLTNQFFNELLLPNPIPLFIQKFKSALTRKLDVPFSKLN